MTSGEAAFKEIASPDGVLAFRVPTHWHESQDSDGTRAFHDPAADTGVLRVKVFTFTSKQQVGAGVARRELEAMAPAPGQRLEVLPSGVALRTHREETDAGGERSVLHLWLLAREDPPHRLRLAVFSFSVPSERALDLSYRRVLAAVDREIRAARIGAPPS
jgi:hypothetical protein